MPAVPSRHLSPACVQARLEAFTRLLRVVQEPGVALLHEEGPAEDVPAVFASLVALKPQWSSALFAQNAQAAQHAFSAAAPAGWKKQRGGLWWYSSAGLETSIGAVSARWPGRYWNFVLVDARGTPPAPLGEALVENIHTRLRPQFCLVVLAGPGTSEWQAVQRLYSEMRTWSFRTVE